MVTNGAAVAGERRIALLIDADNVSHTQIAAILAELSARGTVNIWQAYGDWGSPQLAGWKAQLHDFAIRPIQQFSCTAGKNATDIALVIDAMELLYAQKLDESCIASSDADFTPLLMQQKSNGHEVYDFGERKTPAPFVNACTTFLFLERSAEPDSSLVGQVTLATPSAEAKTATPRPSAVKRLPIDDELKTILKGAVGASKRDNGWAKVAAAGSATKRQAPIDPRNHGEKNFPVLYEATDLFVIVKGKDGQGYIADKQNKDRADNPKL